MATGILIVALAAIAVHVALWWLVWFRFRERRDLSTLVLLLSALAVGTVGFAGQNFSSPTAIATMALQTLVIIVYGYAKYRAANFVVHAPEAKSESPVVNAETLAEKLKTAEQKVATLEAVKTDFVTIAGHELQTPMAQLRGAIDLLDALHQAQALDADQTAELIAALRSAEERLETLVSDMLDASQVALGELKPELAETRIEDVVRQAVEPFAADIRQRRLSVGVVGVRDLPPILADSARLAQALRNIILNAIKFTPDGGKVRVSGTVVTETTPHTLLLTIADTGVGVAETDLELIFHPFYRAHAPEQHSSGAVKFMGAGPGFGLHIARGIVEAHGGRMWAESRGYDPEASPGTTILISLPIITPQDQADKMSDNAPASAV